jgi:hypothetical protein
MPKWWATVKCGPRLMAAVLQHLGVEAAWLDARDFLRAERAAQPQVDEGLSYPLLQQLMVQHPGKRLVVTGFISRSNAGETVLLGVTVLTTPQRKSVRWRACPASLSGATWPGFTARTRVK